MTFDAQTGNIYRGALPVVLDHPHALFEVVRSWRASLTPPACAAA